MDEVEITFALSQTRANLANDETLVRDMAEIFIADVPELCERLDTLRHRASDNPQAVEQWAADARHLAHSIKGLANTFGAQPLVDLAAEIEKSPSAWLADQSASPRWIRRVGYDSAARLATALGIGQAE